MNTTVAHAKTLDFSAHSEFSVAIGTLDFAARSCLIQHVPWSRPKSSADQLLVSGDNIRHCYCCVRHMGTLLDAGRLMAELTEIRIDGRGGQGNVVAAYMLAQAGFEAGRFVQAFPSFGPERRGAPVAAFVRVSDRPIRRRCQISQPHYVIIQDPSLLHVAGIAQNMGPGGGVLVNSSKQIEGLVRAAGVMVVSVPATAMALRFLGQPIPNTALLAAFLSLSQLFPLAALERVLTQRFKGEALQRNLRLMREAAASVSAGSWKDASRAPGN